MAGYPDFWRRKIHKFFTLLDSHKRGYITDDSLWEKYQHLVETYPHLESHFKDQHDYKWKAFLNNGKDVPKDYQLTEEEFLKNLWAESQQPDFKDKMEKLAEESFEKMDLQHKGYITVEEYSKIVAGLMDIEKARKVFDAIDANHDGKMDRKELMRAKIFFFSNASDESNPLNLIYGPLD